MGMEKDKRTLFVAKLASPELSGKTASEPCTKASVIPTSDNSAKTVTQYVGYVKHRRIGQAAAKKWTNMEAAEQPKARELNSRNILKAFFPLEIAMPFSLYPPGIEKAAANVTVAIIVDTNKLRPAVFLRSREFFSGSSSL